MYFYFLFSLRIQLNLVDFFITHMCFFEVKISDFISLKKIFFIELIAQYPQIILNLKSTDKSRLNFKKKIFFLFFPTKFSDTIELTFPLVFKIELELILTKK